MSLLESQAPGTFVVEGDESADDLEQGIRDREIVGGFDFSDPQDMQVYVASAGSTAVSETVSNVGATMAGSTGQTAEIVEVVPLPAGDPTGVGIGGLAFPLGFGGFGGAGGGAGGPDPGLVGLGRDRAVV